MDLTTVRPATATALLTALALIALALPPMGSVGAHAQVSALVLEVTTTDDLALGDTGVACPAEADDECSLRAAVETADGAADGEEVTIQLDAATYDLDHADGQLELETGAVVTISGDGPDATVIDADDLDDRVIEAIGTDLTLSDLAAVNGATNANGGAVQAEDGTLLIQRARFDSNASTNNFGGAVNVRGGDAEVHDSSFTGNSASASGGALRAEGGGELHVEGSTVDGNVADDVGGGIEVIGTGSDLAVVNSTVSGNVAGLRGGGVEVGTGASGSLDGVTVTDNDLEATGDDLDGGFGVATSNGGTLDLVNTIVADNQGDACASVSGGSFQSGGHNLDSDDTCGLDAADGDVPAGAAGLGELADNGGPTLTHALGDESDAIENGDTDLDTDQRGVERPQGDAADIGAVEMEPVEPGAITGWVHDAGFDPVAGGTVTAEGPSTSSDTTTTSGSFEIDDLLAGTYTVTIEADGFADRTIEDLEVDAGETSSISTLLQSEGCDWEWLGDQGDSWHESGNWLGPGSAPRDAAGETVCIEVDTNLPVVHGTGETTVGAIVDGDDPGTSTLEIAGGTLTLTGPTELDGGMTLHGGQLAAQDDLEIHGPAVLGGGALTGDGTTTLSGDVEIDDIQEQPAIEDHDLTLTGETEVRFPLRLNQSMLTNTGDLELAGTGSFGSLPSDGDSQVVNEGMVRKTDTGSSQLTVPFDNATGATVRIDEGMLSVNRGGVSHGDWEIGEGATLSQGLNVTYEHTSDSTILGDVVGETRGGTLDPRQSGLSVAQGTRVEVGHIGLVGNLALEDAEVSAQTLESTSSSHSRLTGDGLVEVAQDAHIERGELLDDTVLDVGGDLVFPDFSDFVSPDAFVDATVTVAGEIRHEDGDIEVGPTGDLRADGGYVHTEGLLLLDGGVVDSDYSAEVDAVIEGNGAVAGDLVSDGTVDPKLPPEAVEPPPGEGASVAAQSAAERTLAATGDYTPDGAGTLEIHVDGPDAGEFDRLEVGGAASLAGTLAVTVDDDADLRPGDEMAVVLAEEVTGEFDVEELPELVGDDQLQVDYRDEAVVLRFGDLPSDPEPEPGAACPDGEVPDAGFVDVPTGSVHAPAIDCIAWYRITLGTTSTTFEPGSTVTRAQKTSFVGRMLEAADYELPDVDGEAFDDIAGSTHAEAISQLAELGIVEGDGFGSFAPSDAVTRAQSASMIVRALDLVLDEPLPAPAGPFTDTSGSVHEEAIDAAAAAGITRGVTSTAFEPGADARRDQMASLLARTLEVLVDEGVALTTP